MLLVGGSSRIPLVAELVTSSLGRPVAVDANPKDAVRFGAALAASRSVAVAPPVAVAPAPPPVIVPVAPTPPPAPAPVVARMACSAHNNSVLDSIVGPLNIVAY